MRYRLGIDLGTHSLGWCLLRLNEQNEPYAVIKTGVRIFSDGRTPDKGLSLASVRRSARQARRQRDRFLKRKRQLLKQLVRLGFFPESLEEQRHLVPLDPYLLRKKGLDYPLTPAEFGRVVFHMNQRRAFQSNRKTERKQKTAKKMQEAIERTREQLKCSLSRTVGEWLADRHEKRLPVRDRTGKVVKSGNTKTYLFCFERKMLLDEFEQLWQKQASLQPSFYTTEKKAILTDVLFFQRKLRPVLPGRCSLIPQERRAPWALPSVQRFRILQEVNNLRIVNVDLTVDNGLDLAQQQQVVTALEGKDKLTFSQIKKLLQFSGDSRFNLENGKRESLKGNRTHKELSHKEAWGEAWFSLSCSERESIVKRLLSEESETSLENWLIQTYGLDQSRVERIIKLALPTGYAHLSEKAISVLLPFMEKGLRYDEAVVAAGLVSHSQLSYGEKIGEQLDELPYYGRYLQRHVGFGSGDPDDPEEIRFGKIANPTVHIALNQLRLIVNALISRYGSPQEVVIELARDLKNSRRIKERLLKEQKARETINQAHKLEISNVLQRDPSTISRRDLEKWRLWVELNPADPFNRCCPYTGRKISCTSLYSHEIETEHILPFSRTLDDSITNKTLCYRQANHYKGAQTPDEAFNTPQAFQDGYNYEAIVERTRHLPFAKAKRFAPGAYQHWLNKDADFVARALNDTRYLSCMALEYLSLICPKNRVTTGNGRLTALLRHHYGLDTLLHAQPYKNRDDHRHHAIDAVVVALTSRTLLTQVATASAKFEQMGVEKQISHLPEPWPHFRERVRQSIMTIKVSHRPDHRYEGELHKATAVSPKNANNASYLLVRQPAETRFPRQARQENGEFQPYKAYQFGNNYCIEIIEEQGKWKGEVITRFMANQIVQKMDKTHGKGAGWRRLQHPKQSQSGQPLMMRLFINDTVELHTQQGKQLCRVVKLSASNGVVTLAPVHEANIDARYKTKTFQYINRVAGSLQRDDARKITLSPLGF